MRATLRKQKRLRGLFHRTKGDVNKLTHAEKRFYNNMSSDPQRAIIHFPSGKHVRNVGLK